MFFLGLVTGFVLGAIWMVGARIVVKMRRERIVASSASRNSAMDEIAAVLSTCKGATISDSNMIGIAVIKLRQLRQ
jgi:hypothetical protein